MDWDQVVTVGGVVAAIAIIAGAIIALFKGVKWLGRLGRNLTHFFDDWKGQEARDGKPACPGVMARLGSVERELKSNGGSTLKDAVTRMEGQLMNNTGTLEGISGSVSTLDERVAALEAVSPARWSGRMKRKT